MDGYRNLACFGYELQQCSEPVADCDYSVAAYRVEFHNFNDRRHDKRIHRLNLWQHANHNGYIFGPHRSWNDRDGNWRHFWNDHHQPTDGNQSGRRNV